MVRLWKSLIRHRWSVLAVLALVTCAAFLAGPHLWAWYHWHAALADLKRYHNVAARAHLDNCLSVWATSAPTHFLAARAARRFGAYEEAEEHLRECERLDPNLADQTALEWALLRAAASDLTPDVEEALLGQVERAPAGAPLIMEALAEGYTRTYRIQEAFSCLDRWLKMQPDNPQALYLRGSVWRQAKKLQNGLADFRRVLELDSERDDARWWLAVGLLDSGRYEEAETHLEYLRHKSPENPDLRVYLALCQKGLGHLEQARRTLRGVLRDYPGNGVALRAQGEVELAAGRPDQAEACLRQATSAMPFDYQSHLWLYQALRHQAKDAEARQEKDRVENLKDRLARLGDIMTSKMSIHPNDPALHCEMGSLLISLGQKKVGESWLESALRKDANYRPAHAALAEFYREQGDSEKAAFHRQQAEEAPDSSPALSPRSP